MLDKLLAMLGQGPEQWDGSERRQGFRARCDFEVEISAPNLSYMGKALDLGPQGMRFRVRGPYNPRVMRKGLEVNLKYLTPLFGAERDTVKAVVRWVKKEGDAQFQVAVFFTDEVENLKKSWLKVVLQKGLGMKAIRSRRQHLRVRCAFMGQVRYENKALEIKVINLSASGAELESLKPIPVPTHLMLYFQNLSMKATVRRCELEYGVYKVGVIFLEDKKTRKQALETVKKLVELEKRRKL